MNSTFTLLLVMMLFAVYTTIGGAIALYWAVKLIIELIMRISKSVTDKLLPGWL